MTPDGQLLYATYKSVFTTVFEVKWEALDELSQKQWEEVAKKFIHNLELGD
jgi:hypothetical protein